MLKIRVMYELYVKEINDRILPLSLSLQLKKKDRDNYLALLTKYKRYIEQVYPISYDDLINIKSIKELKALDKFDSNEMVDTYIELLVKTNKKIQTLEAELRNLNTRMIDFPTYRTIIDKFNDKIVDEIVERNYYFHPVPYFGGLAIVIANQTRPQYDWKKSTEMKNAIIARGEIPYYKKDAEAAAKRGEEYKGVKWLIERPRRNYFFNWFITGVSKTLNPLMKDYKFVPGRRRDPSLPSPVRKLQNIKDDPDRAAKLYTRTLNYSDHVEYQAS